MNQEINCKYVNQLPPTSHEAFVFPEMRLGRTIGRSSAYWHVLGACI